MSHFIQRLRDIKDVLIDSDRKQQYLQEILAQGAADPDEFTSLVHTIITNSYLAGYKQAHRHIPHMGNEKKAFQADEQAEKLSPIIESLRSEGVNTLQGIADELNQRGLHTRGQHLWSASSVRYLLKRIDKIKEEGIVAPQSHYDDVMPLISNLRQSGETFATIAETLNEGGYRTESGSIYIASMVRRIATRGNHIGGQGNPR